MKINVGGWDQNTRFVLGSAAIVAALVGRLPRAWRIALLTLGAAEFTTATTRYCPVNELLGVDTRQPQDVARDVADAAREAARDVQAVA